MSTEVTKVMSASFWRSMKQDVTSMRQLRFGFGIAISGALAYGVNWPFSFLLPILCCTFLALPLPKPSLTGSLKNMFQTLVAFALGVIFSMFFLQYPIAYVMILGVVLFHIYYYINRGGSFWFALMVLCAVLILPTIANSNEGAAVGFSIGFIGTSWLTIAMIWLMHFIFPDPQFTHFPKSAGLQKGYSKAAAMLALRSTLVVLPITVVFIVYDLGDYLLVMMFAAIFTLKPELSAGKQAGTDSMLSTLLGGSCAWIFYWLVVAVPLYHFFVLLLLGTSLYFGRCIFSSKSTAKYYGSALTAMLIVFNSSMAANVDINAVLVTRILLISGAIAYIVIALKMLDHYGIAKT